MFPTTKLEWFLMECCVSHSQCLPGQLGLGHIHKDHTGKKRRKQGRVLSTGAFIALTSLGFNCSHLWNGDSLISIYFKSCGGSRANRSESTGTQERLQQSITTTNTTTITILPQTKQLHFTAALQAFEVVYRKHKLSHSPSEDSVLPS